MENLKINFAKPEAVSSIQSKYTLLYMTHDKSDGILRQPGIVVIKIGETQDPSSNFSNQELYLRNFLDKGTATNKVIKYKVSIDELINFNYSLKKPIIVEFEYQDDFELLGQVKDLEIYSFGATEAEVLREINQELTELFSLVVEDTTYELGEKPKAWKNILKRYISKN